MSGNLESSQGEEPQMMLRADSRASGIDLKEAPKTTVNVANDTEAAATKIEKSKAVDPSFMHAFVGEIRCRIAKELEIQSIPGGRTVFAQNNFLTRMGTPLIEEGKYEFDLVKMDELVYVAIHDLNKVDKNSPAHLQTVARYIQGEGEKRTRLPYPHTFPVITPAKPESERSE